MSDRFEDMMQDEEMVRPSVDVDAPATCSPLSSRSAAAGPPSPSSSSTEDDDDDDDDFDQSMIAVRPTHDNAKGLEALGYVFKGLTFDSVDAICSHFAGFFAERNRKALVLQYLLHYAFEPRAGQVDSGAATGWATFKSAKPDAQHGRRSQSLFACACGKLAPSSLKNGVLKHIFLHKKLHLEFEAWVKKNASDTANARDASKSSRQQAGSSDSKKSSSKRPIVDDSIETPSKKSKTDTPPQPHKQLPSCLIDSLNDAAAPSAASAKSSLAPPPRARPLSKSPHRAPTQKDLEAVGLSPTDELPTPMTTPAKSAATATPVTSSTPTQLQPPVRQEFARRTPPAPTSLVPSAAAASYSTPQKTTNPMTTAQVTLNASQQQQQVHRPAAAASLSVPDPSHRSAVAASSSASSSHASRGGLATSTSAPPLASIANSTSAAPTASASTTSIASSTPAPKLPPTPTSTANARSAAVTAASSTAAAAATSAPTLTPMTVGSSDESDSSPLDASPSISSSDPSSSDDVEVMIRNMRKKQADLDDAIKSRNQAQVMVAKLLLERGEKVEAAATARKELESLSARFVESQTDLAYAQHELERVQQLREDDRRLLDECEAELNKMKAENERLQAQHRKAAQLFTAGLEVINHSTALHGMTMEQIASTATSASTADRDSVQQAATPSTAVGAATPEKSSATQPKASLRPQPHVDRPVDRIPPPPATVASAITRSV